MKDESKTFDNIVVSRYKNYAMYSNLEKMLPNPVDGLLPVQKRILLTLHLTASNGFVKTAKVVGDNMSMFHPHAPADGTVASMVQNSFAVGDGNWGSSLGIEEIEPAAMRYTKVKASPLIEDIAFKLINHVEWIDGELDNKEPKYIPTMFPFCLFSKKELNMIGFGFKTEIPNYKIEDLKSRLLYLKGDIKKRPIIKPNIKGCDILSNDKELEQLLITGNGKLVIRGKYSIKPEEKRIYIHGWSPRIKFDTFLNKIDRYKGWNLLSSGDIGYIDESSDKTGTKIRIEVSKQRNTDAIFIKMKEAVEKCLIENISYRMYFGSLDDGIKLMSVDSVLLRSYEFYKQTLNSYYKNTIIKLKQKMDELKIIEKIRPYISSCLEKGSKFEDSIKKLSKLSGLSIEEIVPVVEKYKIKALISANTDISAIQEEIKNMKECLKNIDETTINCYRSLKL